MEFRHCNEFMEIRSYQGLKEELENLYQRYSDEQLKQYFNSKSQHTPKFGYDYPSNDNRFKHTIILTIPGYKAFNRDQNGKFFGNKKANDIKITLRVGDANTNVRHEEVIEDLYKKVNESKNRTQAYNICKGFLTNLYRDEVLNPDYFLKPCNCGYQLPILASFIRWCGVQEMINYPYKWGRDLSFARYFEAIYAGYLGNKKMLNQIIERAGEKRTPLNLQAVLNHHEIDDDIYNGLLQHRM